jgi:hypothetical protein
VIFGPIIGHLLNRDRAYEMAEHLLASSIQHPASSIQHPASSIQYPASKTQDRGTIYKKSLIFPR